MKTPYDPLFMHKEIYFTLMVGFMLFQGVFTSITYINSNSRPMRRATILMARDPGVISISYNIGLDDIFNN